MYYRRKILMALIETFGGRMYPISLQKSLFLFTREQEPEERVYSFVPYKYGCFSFNVNHDISVLEKTGYLRSEDKEIVIAKFEGVTPICQFDYQYFKKRGLPQNISDIIAEFITISISSDRTLSTICSSILISSSNPDIFIFCSRDSRYALLFD